MKQEDKISYEVIKVEIKSLNEKVDTLSENFKGFKSENKEEFDNIRKDIKESENKLRGEIESSRSELKSDIKEFRGELKSDIKEFRDELKSDIKEFKDEIKNMGTKIDDTGKIIIGILIALLAGMFGIIAVRHVPNLKD